MEFGLALVVCLAFFTAGFVQTMAGFGSALVAVPLLACVLPMRVAVPVVCLLNLGLNAALAGRLRVHIQWRLYVWLLPAALPGMILGALGLGLVPSGVLEAVLGLSLLVFVWWQWRPRACRRRVGRLMGVVAGFFSGLFGALLGANGPPVVAWMACQDFPRDTVRATLTAYFFLAGLCVVATQAVGGLVTGRVFLLAALGLPALAAGILAGLVGCGRIGETGFRRLLLGLLAATGLSLLVQFGLTWT